MGHGSTASDRKAAIVVSFIAQERVVDGEEIRAHPRRTARQSPRNHSPPYLLHKRGHVRSTLGRALSMSIKSGLCCLLKRLAHGPVLEQVVLVKMFGCHKLYPPVSCKLHYGHMPTVMGVGYIY